MPDNADDLDRLEAIHAEVVDIVEARGQHWRRLQDRVAGVVRDYESVAALYGAIYRIYSRSDKQATIQPFNPHLKSTQKIVEEINIQRHGGTKIRNGKAVQVKAHPQFSIYDISDLVGVTIVCPFPSDVAKVVAYIEADDRLGVRSDKKVHERADYAATHMYIGFEDEPFYGLVCELQIKTAFQDAFGWKTHGLSYKAEASTDGWLIDQLNKINVVIRAADEMSDQLRARIVRENAHGLARRQQAKQSLKENLAATVRTEPDKPRRLAISEILQHLDEARQMNGGASRAERLKNLRANIDKLLKDFGYTATTFRVAALYAIDCGRNDQLFWLDRHHRTWSDGLDPNADPDSAEQFYRAAVTCGIAHYCAGDLKGAVRVGEEALRRFDSTQNLLVGQLTTNVAYFYAEWFALDGKTEHAAKAAHLANRAETLMMSHKAPLLKDTVGFVLIQTAQSVEDIERGLALCRQSHADIQNSSNETLKPTSQQFFELHREIAYQRLAELTQSAEEDVAKK